jgi:hypothetical protein
MPSSSSPPPASTPGSGGWTGTGSPAARGGDRHAPRPDEPGRGDHRRRRRRPNSVITDQVTNGIAVRMSCLYLMLGGEARRRRGDRRHGGPAPRMTTRPSSPSPGPGSSTRPAAATRSQRRRRGRPHRAVGEDSAGAAHRRANLVSRRASSTSTSTCASPAARPPRPSRPAPPPPRRSAGSPPCARWRTPNPVADHAGVVEQVLRLAREAGTATSTRSGRSPAGLAGEELAELGAMAAAGVRCFSDDGMPVRSAQVMRRALSTPAPGTRSSATTPRRRPSPPARR